MNTEDNIHAGIELIQRGWRQGSLLHNPLAPKMYPVLERVKEEDMENTEADVSLPFYPWKTAEVPFGESDLLVIITQDCDLGKKPEIEPYVEAAGAFWTCDRDIIHKARTNSAYYIPLQERNNWTEVLIVDLRCRSLIKKEALLECHFVSHSDGENNPMLRNFRRGLGRRYLRQALRDELGNAVNKPIVRAIRRLRARRTPDPLLKTIDNLREIRFLEQNDTLPFHIEMLFLYDETCETPPTHEEAVRLANWMDDILKKNEQATLVGWDMPSTEKISVYDYENSNELDLHEFTSP